MNRSVRRSRAIAHYCLIFVCAECSIALQIFMLTRVNFFISYLCSTLTSHFNFDGNYLIFVCVALARKFQLLLCERVQSINMRSARERTSSFGLSAPQSKRAELRCRMQNGLLNINGMCGCAYAYTLSPKLGPPKWQ